MAEFSVNDNDKCNEDDEEEIEVEHRAGQHNCRSVPHSRTESHFLACKRARVEWGPCLVWVASARGRVVGWGCCKLWLCSEHSHQGALGDRLLTVTVGAGA